jgi:gas vesicle protein GvpL/GvpF
VIQLLAITDDPRPPQADLVELEAVTRRGLTALCTSAPAPEELTAGQLWRHEEIVEALMADRNLLPVRYGSRVDDRAVVAQTLEDRHDELTEALNFVRGAVEVSLRVLSDEDGLAEAPAQRFASGSEYLRAKARLRDNQAVAARAVHEPLLKAARAGVTRPTGRAGERLLAAYLIDREELESFTSLVAQLQEANPGLRLICTGPWPPYSFVER